MVRTEAVLTAPVMTEKTVKIPGKYAFRVHPDASKMEVKAAVKQFYGVEVDRVNVINLPEKKRMSKARTQVRKSAPYKKAIVTLKKGQELNFNDFK